MSADLASRLMRHVATLAGTIGERNVYRPAALDAAARYIEGEWAGQGLAVRRQAYAVSGIECANLEVVLPGRRWADEHLVVGAHYDSVRGAAQAPMTTPARWLRCSRSPGCSRASRPRAR